MESLLRITGLCLTGAVFAAVLKKHSPEMALLLAVALCTAGLFLLAREAEEATSLLRLLLARGGISETLFTPVLKTVCIAVVGRAGGELCRDAGEHAAAYTVELAGVFAALLASVPLWEAVWELLEGVL